VLFQQNAGEESNPKRQQHQEKLKNYQWLKEEGEKALIFVTP